MSAIRDARVYVRKFSWDRARELRADGWTYQRIADDLGVTLGAVRFACDDDARMRERAYHRAWQQTGVCIDCGGPRSQNPTVGVERCRACNAKRQQTSVLPTLLKCGRCDSWLPDDAYGNTSLPQRAHRRGRRHHCRACETAMRRDRRRRTGSA